PMRIWTLHPKYLDAKGLVALWRETLLAQKVLKGETRGYTNHPQLNRFKARKNACKLVSAYLSCVCEEAERRGYSFDRSKIQSKLISTKIICANGQLLYEWQHLRAKLKTRAPKKYKELGSITVPDHHPIFKIIDGEVESWEIMK